MAKTGELSERSGFYRSQCCSDELPLIEKEKFPQCRRCEQPAGWILVRPTSSSEKK